MSAMEQLMQAALAAPEERREQALKVLKGEPVGRTVTGPLLMGMGEASKFLGVSRSTLWRILQAGTIGKVELFPGSFRVRREDLMALAAGDFGFSKKVSRRGRRPSRTQRALQHGDSAVAESGGTA